MTLVILIQGMPCTRDHTRVCSLSFCLLRPVISRITEYNDSNHAMRFGIENLDSTKWASILCESNFARQLDIGRCECGEVIFVGTTDMDKQAPLTMSTKITYPT
jgi:hypothetical protein